MARDCVATVMARRQPRSCSSWRREWDEMAGETRKGRLLPCKSWREPPCEILQKDRGAFSEGRNGAQNVERRL